MKSSIIIYVVTGELLSIRGHLAHILEKIITMILFYCNGNGNGIGNCKGKSTVINLFCINQINQKESMKSLE